MEMVKETLTKKQKEMLAMEGYLDLVDGHKNLEDLTVRQLNQILGMHGFNKMQCQKKNLVEVVSRIQLMNLGRSTLQDDSVSPCDCLDLKVVMKDLKAIDWNECHITSLHTQNAANSASSAAVSVKKPKKVRAATSLTNTGTASSTGTVSVKKPKKARVAASVTNTGTASSTGTNGTVSVKKPKKARVAASVTATGTASSAGTKSAVSLKKHSGTAVAAGSTTVGA